MAQYAGVTSKEAAESGLCGGALEVAPGLDAGDTVGIPCGETVGDTGIIWGYI